MLDDRGGIEWDDEEEEEEEEEGDCFDDDGAGEGTDE